MNWQRGLERVSAAWWGVLGLIGVIAVAGGAFKQDVGLVGGGVAGLVACYIAHRITCWILAGFFSPRS